jgi:hypothetical protein
MPFSNNENPGSFNKTGSGQTHRNVDSNKGRGLCRVGQMYDLPGFRASSVSAPSNIEFVEEEYPKSLFRICPNM